MMFAELNMNCTQKNQCICLLFLYLDRTHFSSLNYPLSEWPTKNDAKTYILSFSQYYFYGVSIYALKLLIKRR